MIRRNFLKMQAALIGSALIDPPSLLAQTALPDIAVVKGDPAKATRAAVNAIGGIQAFVKAGQKVVIKPNMSFAANVDSAANTHPDVVKELVILCHEAKAASVHVLDHAFRHGRQPMEYSGILAACDSVSKGICRNLTSSRNYRDFTLKDAKTMHTNAAMLEVLEADVIIACPVAKSHSSTGVSLSLKGQMGLILDRGCMHGQYDLDTAIVDLASALKPALVVIDASRVLSTNGPYGPGKVLKPGEIIASADPVAADAFAVASYPWYGQKIRPNQVAHLIKAHERGLGRMDVQNLKLERIGL